MNKTKHMASIFHPYFIATPIKSFSMSQSKRIKLDFGLGELVSSERGELDLFDERDTNYNLLICLSHKNHI